MRIIKIAYDWPPPWQGLAPHPYELTFEQAKLGHKFDLFCGRWPKAGNVEKIDGVTVHPFIREPIPGTLTVTTSIAMFFYYIFWRMKNKADLIHTHGHFAIWIYFYRMLLMRFYKEAEELDTPLIVHFHNTVKGRWESAEENNADIKFISKYFSWPMELLANKWAVKVADALIFVSQDNKDEAIKYYNADPSKCFVVESGVNADTFKTVGPEEREKTRKDIGLDIFDKVVLNHGVMLERKNIHLLVEAMEYLPTPYKLLLAGPGDSAYLAKLEKLINDKKLSNRVIRVGYVPYPQTPIVFQASDVFVLPSNWEGTPKVVMQSLACGVPAVVSGFKLADELSGIYYLDNLEPKDIAAKIMEVVEHPRSVDTSTVISKYSWRQKVLQIEDIYKKVLANHSN